MSDEITVNKVVSIIEDVLLPSLDDKNFIARMAPYETTQSREAQIAYAYGDLIIEAIEKRFGKAQP